MHKKELVSIVMPLYNCAGLVEQSIESVQAQTYENWELLVVDDLSTDGSYDIVKAYAQHDPRIRLLQNSSNSGAAVSRNYALREAKGKWVAFLDSDDLWLPEKLMKQVAFMEETGCHFSYTQYAEMNDGGELTGNYWTGPKKVGKVKMFAYDYVGCLTVMYDRAYVGLVQIPDLKKRNDYALWLKVIQKCPCYLLPEILAKYRVRTTGSVTDRKAGILKRVRHYYRMYRISEEMNPVAATWCTGVNLVFGALKKLTFKRKLRQNI